MTLGDLGSDVRIAVFPREPNFLIFSDGRVYSLRFQRFIKTSFTLCGYPRFTYKINGKTKTIAVHLAVAEAFLGKPPKGFQCAHLDGNRKNPHLSNLAFMTPMENTSHKKIHGTNLAGEKHPNAKLSAADVEYIRKHHRVLGPNKSNSGELAKRFGISRHYVNHLVRGFGWGAKPRSNHNRARALLEGK